MMVHLLRLVFSVLLVTVTVYAQDCLYTAKDWSADEVGTCIPEDVSESVIVYSAAIGGCLGDPFCILVVLQELNASCVDEYGSVCIVWLGFFGSVCCECDAVISQTTVTGVDIEEWLGDNEECPFKFEEVSDPDVSVESGNVCHDVALTPNCRLWAHGRHIVRRVLCLGHVCTTPTHLFWMDRWVTMGQLCQLEHCSAHTKLVNTCLDQDLDVTVIVSNKTAHMSEFNADSPIWAQKAMNSVARPFRRIQEGVVRTPRTIVVWLRRRLRATAGFAFLSPVESSVAVQSQTNDF